MTPDEVRTIREFDAWLTDELNAYAELEALENGNDPVALRKALDEPGRPGPLRHLVQQHDDGSTTTTITCGDSQFAKSLTQPAAVDVDAISKAVAEAVSFDVDAMADQVIEKMRERGEFIEVDVGQVLRDVIAEVGS